MTMTVAAGAAARIRAMLTAATGVDLPMRLRAWDGSEAGPASGVVVDVRSSEALRQVVWRPGELGLARAYVSGTLDVDGDLEGALKAARRALGEARRPRPTPAGAARVLGIGAGLGVLGLPPRRPPEEARLRGRLHSPARDRAAIRHHYDLGNDVYELLLDASMSYSCGYWAPVGGAATPTDVAGASRAKLDLVCRKLGLRPGMLLVDVGCGWGSLVTHAAHHYGVRVVGYTVSAAQAAYVRERIEREGLGGVATVHARDYREIDLSGADAVASIEMGEHVGDDQYPRYAAILHGLLRPHGRLLLQQMSRGPIAPGGGAFIESYIAPDMHMRPLTDTLAMLGVAGLEIRDVEAMREHYPRTIRGWATRLEERWGEFAALAGERTARIWRLYLAGGALAFEENRMGVDQVLAVRPGPDGRTGMPAGRPWALPPRDGDG